ncbi:MAG: hypothetical protein A2X81_10345 [Desulfobacterales bacterium GWB2_56_26]|nr:MAG: hypothetical protein A2X81_10345 [Desulfobacterales bacterium GWB2_56_26]
MNEDKQGVVMNITNSLVNNEKGATVVYVAIILGVLVMFTALAIDVGHLYGVRNELQNAADAGSLAGAGVLFIDEDGEGPGQSYVLNPNADQIAERVADANPTGDTFVDISIEDVEIGHWSFASQAFNVVEGEGTTEWNGKTFEELDTDTNFINAVKVQARREAPRFFARIFGTDPIDVSADAVAYIGFPDTIFPQEVDQPIALCEEAITVGSGEETSLNCGTGRMFPDPSDTGGWTNLQQPGICSDTEDSSGANENQIRDLICSGNTTKLDPQDGGLQMINGAVGDAFNRIHSCWEAASANRTKPVQWRLPVIRCGDSGIHGCKEFLYVVTVDVIWINRNDNSANMNDAPTYMEKPLDSPNITENFDQRANSEGTDRWDKFVEHFHLEEGTPYRGQTIYFLPSCRKDQRPVGSTGGPPSLIRAKVPVLVE